MNQYLLFRSNGVFHGIKIKYVHGATSEYDGDFMSASKCFFGTVEEEGHFINISGHVLSVSQVLDIVNILESYRVPSFFRTTPVSEIAEYNGNIVILLDAEKLIEKCLKKGEKNGR